MSILEDLATAAGAIAQAELNKKADGWFDDTMKKGREAASGIGDPIAKAAAEAALNALDANKSKLLQLGGKGLTAMIAFLALGNTKRAEDLLFLSKEADLDSLLAASNASTAKVVAAKKASDQAKAEMKQMFKDISITVAKAALPLLLAVI